jgi:hypothetical protein
VPAGGTQFPFAVQYITQNLSKKQIYFSPRRTPPWVGN